MAYKTFTPKQRATVQALVTEMRRNALLWVDVTSWVAGYSKGYWIEREADDWDQEGSNSCPASYIKTLREVVRKTRRSQADVFAAIRVLGYSVKKTDWGDYRVAPQIKFISTSRERRRAEERAAYCSDLAEALANAVYWAEGKKADADAKERRALIDSWEPRARQILQQKRLAYGDSFATAEEAAIQAEDPLAWVELINEYAEAEIGINYRGQWAADHHIEQSVAAVAAEGLEAKALANSPSDTGAAVAQLVKAAKAARFALESAVYLQGLKALAPAALDLIAALEPFEAEIDVIAQAQMSAAVLSGRPDLAA